MGKQGYKGSKCWNDTLLSNNDISDENYFATITLCNVFDFVYCFVCSFR